MIFDNEQFKIETGNIKNVINSHTLNWDNFSKLKKKKGIYRHMLFQKYLENKK